MICIIDYLIIATLKLVMLSNFTQLMHINTATYKLSTALGVQLQDTNCLRSLCSRIIQICLLIMHDDCHSWWLHTKNKTLLDCLMVLLFYIPDRCLLHRMTNYQRCHLHHQFCIPVGSTSGHCDCSLTALATHFITVNCHSGAVLIIINSCGSFIKIHRQGYLLLANICSIQSYYSCLHICKLVKLLHKSYGKS